VDHGDGMAHNDCGWLKEMGWLMEIGWLG
jgi:hypothetical protein